MYAPGYGFGSGNISSQYNPNGVPPPPLVHHTQQQQQTPAQQSHHMMYSGPQYGVAAAAATARGSQPLPYGVTGNGIGGNASPMGIAQNSSIAHVATNGIGNGAGAGASGVVGMGPSYQTPYGSSPYGGNVPTAAANMPPNFMPSSTPYSMTAPNMGLQHQAQRMQQQPLNSSTPIQTGQRASPFGGQHNTPPNSSSTLPQFSTPLSNTQTHLQTPNNNQQGQPGVVLTPQTPTFPPTSHGVNAGYSLATPLSPASESREKERVTLLLDINKELLMVVIKLQATQNDPKRDDATPSVSSPDGSEKDKAKPTATRDYVECMRRLQSNLAYLAAIADRSHKPSNQIPAHPAIMTAPKFSQTAYRANLSTTASPTSDTREEWSDEKRAEETLDNHEETLKEQYRNLQLLFPGIDSRKEIPATATTRGQPQQQPQKSGLVDHMAQQKMQNDLSRQKIMQSRQSQPPQQQQQMYDLHRQSPW